MAAKIMPALQKQKPIQKMKRPLPLALLSGMVPNLLDQDMEEYINHATELGVVPMDAKKMCANFEHLGSQSAVIRILAKTPTPYTLDGIYNASQSDTGNQVGTYRPRNDMVYAAIKQYITNYEVTPEAAVEAVISVARNEVGYLEKASDAYLDSKTENAGKRQPKGERTKKVSQCETFFFLR